MTKTKNSEYDIANDENGRSVPGDSIQRPIWKRFQRVRKTKGDGDAEIYRTHLGVTNDSDFVGRALGCQATRKKRKLARIDAEYDRIGLSPFYGQCDILCRQLSIDQRPLWQINPANVETRTHGRKEDVVRASFPRLGASRTCKRAKRR